MQTHRHTAHDPPTRPRRPRTRTWGSPAGATYVLRTGDARRDVPAETVGRSGVTAWRRLRDWTESDVWPRLHSARPAELRRAGLLDLADCSVNGSHVRALEGGIDSVIARRGVAHGSGLGKVRLVIERAFAWLHRFERLRTRHERRADLHQGLPVPRQTTFALLCGGDLYGPRIGRASPPCAVES
ncbi:hypothetical protein [Streptomyces cellostaticus]|uniref:hypothetical protein n=1 Tax=Streptomyces cellostaticus TaxID=67285 RepID=UPI0035A9194B